MLLREMAILRLIIQVISCAILLSTAVHAEILQILHTNDLHGHFQGLNDEARRGGYAQLKHTISKLKIKARADGIQTLILDGGDFSEGSLEYKAGNGFNTFKMMELMGYDAIALGNHDYLMGPKRLEEILSQMNLPLLAANIKMNPHTPASKKSIQPYRLFEKGNIRIAVIGGTTNEILYKWLFKGNQFSDAAEAINQQAKLLNQSNDLIIALTHIGLEADKILAQKSKSIDLIVGGHSHTKMDEVLQVKNKNGLEIPIVQTGEHGKFLGELLIDVIRNPINKSAQPRLRVLSYKLHPIFQADVVDSKIDLYAKKTKEDIKSAFGDEYLHEILGESSIPMSVTIKDNVYLQTFWTAWMTKAIQDEAQADLAINSLELFGIDQRAGAINRKKIISFYPRFFDVERKEGWHLYTTNVRGYWLNLIIDLCRKKYQPIIFSGLKYELMPDESGEFKAMNINVNGLEIEPFKTYKIAMPEGIFRGMVTIVPMLDGRLLHNSQDTGISIVDAIANRVKAVGSIEAEQVNFDDFSFIPERSQQKN